MSKRSKYRISREEADIATFLRLNSDQWFTDGEVTHFLGGTPHNHLNRLGQLRVVDVLRIEPEPTYRWSAKASQNNPQYVGRLDDAVQRYDIKVLSLGELSEMNFTNVRSVSTALAEQQPIETITIEVTPPEPTVFELPEPVVVPDDGIVDDSEPEYTAEQLKLMHEYERKMNLVRRRGSSGRFVQNNLVWHPVYGSGVVEHQQGGKQMMVKFPRPYGKLVVMDEDLTEDKKAIERAEELTCSECGKKYARAVSNGRKSLYCSSKCRNQRNARTRAETTARAAERTKATAERAVQALQPKAPPEPVAALVDEAPVVTSKRTKLVALYLHEHGEQQPVFTGLMTVETAIDRLMELL